MTELDSMGYGQVAIARLLGVSQPQVCYDLKVVRERYRQTQLETVKASVNQKLEQLRLVRREAFEAWDRSQQKGRPDSAFMDVIMKALRDECDLLGLWPDMEVKGTVGGNGGISWQPMNVPDNGMQPSPVAEDVPDPEVPEQRQQEGPRSMTVGQTAEDVQAA
jgi:hypothetical protein